MQAAFRLFTTSGSHNLQLDTISYLNLHRWCEPVPHHSRQFRFCLFSTVQVAVISKQAAGTCIHGVFCTTLILCHKYHQNHSNRVISLKRITPKFATKREFYMFLVGVCAPFSFTRLIWMSFRLTVHASRPVRVLMAKQSVVYWGLKLTFVANVGFIRYIWPCLSDSDDICDQTEMAFKMSQEVPTVAMDWLDITQKAFRHTFVTEFNHYAQ